jgi:hypothetical protein
MKPVAWTDGKFCLSFAESDVCPIPLYTAPRELSDEEIDSISEYFIGIKPHLKPQYRDFARMILNKASEK